MIDTARTPKNFSIGMACGVSLITAAMLMFEILQTVILSLQLFSKTAFLVVSIALLGLGFGGSVATWIVARRSINPLIWMWGCAICFTVFVPLSMLLISRTHGVLPLIVILIPPFACLGLFLAILFSSWPDRAGTYYAFDLLGSALGCLFVILMFQVFADAAVITLLIAVISGIGTSLLGLLISRRHLLVASATVLLALIPLPWTATVFPFLPNPDKQYGQLLKTAGVQTEVEWSQWGYLGRLDVVRTVAGGNKIWFSPGLGNLLDQGIKHRFLFASGDNWSYALDFGGNEQFEKGAIISHPAASPYVVTKGRVVLVIGVGGGVDLFLAQRHNTQDISAAEINPLMIKALDKLGGSFWAGTLRDPRIKIHLIDGRNFVQTTRQHFDVITLTAVDTGVGLAHGGLVLSENYLYTREAFAQYFDRLNSGGVLYIFRPPHDLLRTIATATMVMRTSGVVSPERHFAVFGDPTSGTTFSSVLIFKDPITEIQSGELRARLSAGEFGGHLVYLPDRSADPAKSVQGTPFTQVVHSFFKHIRGGCENAYYASLPDDITPVTDDRPFFYHQDRHFWKSNAGKLLREILLWVVLIAAVLLFVPLYRTPIPRKTPNIATTLLFFAGIGLGFMLIEISLIQKFSLYLGHPAYSILVTLFGMLLFSGAGSLAAQRLKLQNKTSALHVILGTVAGITVLYALFAQYLLSLASFESLVARVVIILVMLAPGSFLMGMPFPLKISSLPDASKVLVPWGWSVNAFASVIASVLAMMLAINFGFTYALIAGAVSYLLALAAHHLSGRMRDAYAGMRDVDT